MKIPLMMIFVRYTQYDFPPNSMSFMSNFENEDIKSVNAGTIRYGIRGECKDTLIMAIEHSF
ncbi:MAG: hypothetical protein ACP5IB_09865 [Thermoplasmata archaeon]|jgi:hypothetical protein